MKRGTYIGALAHLRGKTALLRYPPEKGFVVAQFDDCSLTRSGESLPLRKEPLSSAPGAPPEDALGFGWHRFRKEEFEEVPSDQA